MRFHLQNQVVQIEYTLTQQNMEVFELQYLMNPYFHQISKNNLS